MNTAKFISIRTKLGRDVFHLYPETESQLHIRERVCHVRGMLLTGAPHILI